MSKFILNRDILRPLDIAFSTNISMFSFLEKWTINGFVKAITDSQQKLPTHILQFIEIYGHLKILEMIVDNNNHKKMKLSLVEIEKYEENGFLGDRIICIKRNALYDNSMIRNEANARHIQRWADGQTFYDISELTFFVPWLKFLGLKNNNQKLVCSSENESELNKDGYSYTDFPLLKNPQGIIPPYAIMTAQHCNGKDESIYPIVTLDKIYK